MPENLIALADALYRRERRLRAEADKAAAEAAATILAKLNDVCSELDRVESQLTGNMMRASYLQEPAMPTEDWLAQAIESEQPVTFEYEDKHGNVTQRTMSPYELYEAGNGDELVRGFDHDRDALRSFRLDHLASYPSIAVADYVAPVED